MNPSFDHSLMMRLTFYVSLLMISENFAIHDSSHFDSNQGSISCHGSSSTRLTSGYHPHHRYPRSIPGFTESQNNNITKRAIYFDGIERILKLQENDNNAILIEKPFFLRNQFSMDIWIRPEGGQYNPAVIFEMSDICSDIVNSYTWRLGIAAKSDDPEKQARYFFTLKTEMSQSGATVWSHTTYKPRKWDHLVVVYGDDGLKFFINGARTGRSTSQTGPLFSLMRSSCKQLVLGGSIVYRSNDKNPKLFRGYVGQLRFWKKLLRDEDVARLYLEKTKTMKDASEKDELFFSETFQNLGHWTSISDHAPLLVEVREKIVVDDMQATVPKCGQTVCDDPNIVLSYVSNAELRKPKTVRYRVVNILEGDGLNPCVSPEQIRIQHEALNKAFAPYNISWRLEIIELQSTALRRKTIIFGCESNKIGNKQCNLECRHPITGNDGGDCLETVYECDPSLLGNHKCDQVCNRPEHKWDHGECCNATSADVHATCVDPNSPLRSYIGVDEYKRILNFTNDHILTITFAEWSNSELIGLATFPWEKEVYSIYGGIIMQPKRFGTKGHRDNLVHEIGHALGLWHVHHGVSESSCEDECREVVPSMLTGDLCDDTNPTPKNMECRDPDRLPTSKHYPNSVTTYQCLDNKEYVMTPFNNYMSYSDEDCTNHFTKQQVARMHCYLDLKYNDWLVKEDDSGESIIPLAPTVKEINADPSRPSVTLTWIPPLDIETCKPVGSQAIYSECTSDGRLIQYASKADSQGAYKASGYWAPHQATGLPDSEPCEASTKAWLPDTTSCDEPGSCRLTLEFETAVVAESLSVWVAWNANDGLKDLFLHFTDGSVESVSPLTPFCDIPFTTPLFQKSKKLKKIEIHTKNPFVSIDAAQIISGPFQEICISCSQLKYRVIRSPGFSDKKYFETNQRSFLDTEVKPNQTYTYQIQVVNGTKMGHLSPPLIFHLNTSICGDGKIDRLQNEECDDGNILDDDGCSSGCKIEKVFNCKNERSLCYVYTDDGICEDFEMTDSIQDCGYYTPDGFHDQWAIDAYSNPPFYDENCNASKSVGPPKVLSCGTNLNSNLYWQPCTTTSETRKPWLLVKFEIPVVATSVIVHLATLGSVEYNNDWKFLRLELVSADNVTNYVKYSEDILLSCSKNPIEYHVWHDLSQPFFYTKSVYLYSSSNKIGITAVRLRSRKFADPRTTSLCGQSGMLYDPQSNQCFDYQCSKPTCPELKVNHGHTTCTGQSSEDSCLVMCREGYLVSGYGQDDISISRSYNREALTKVICSNGQWSIKKLECIPIDCGTPKVSNGEADCPHGTTFNKTCIFRCLPPARMKGVDNVIVCTKAGSWSVPEAYCHLSCAPPSDVDYLYSKTVSKFCRTHQWILKETENVYPVGIKCKFMCRPGYHVEGQTIHKRIFRRTCSEGGHWKGPKCVKIKCSQPKIIYYGLYNCTKGFEIGTECSFRCPGASEIHVSVCNPDGLWTITEPCPLPKGKCSPPISSRDVSVDCPRKPFVGSVCKIACSAYGYEPVLEHLVTTERKFKMQVLLQVPHVTCSVQKSWEPDVHSVVCVKKCTQNFMGDGWCDFQNNRGYCGWDAGDCCASTVKGGKVKLMFPSLCTSHLCRCLDPYAIENRNDLERAKFSSDRGIGPLTIESKMRLINITGETKLFDAQATINRRNTVSVNPDQNVDNGFRSSSKLFHIGSKEMMILNFVHLKTVFARNVADDVYKSLFFSSNSSSIEYEMDKLEILSREYKNFYISTKYVDVVRASIIRALRDQYKHLQFKS